MAAPLLTLQDITLRLGDTALLDGAELSVAKGERIRLVGRNGSGKSTLLKIAAGLAEPDAGSIFRQPGATIRYLPQEPDLTGHASILAYVEAGLQPGDDLHQARYLVEHLGLDAERPLDNLSGGETRRAALARTLAPHPDILLLDEPTNHLDLPAIEWLEQELKSRRNALVIISHDRRFLDTLTAQTVWLDRGRTRRLDKGFAAFEAWRDDILQREEVELHKLDRKIHMEEDWLRYGVTARRKRNQRRLGLLHEMREKRATAVRAQGVAKLATASAEASGKLVIEAEGITKVFDGNAVVSPLSMRIQRGDRIGIIGPNGAGKTTLIRMLTGQLPPDSGSVRIAETAKMVTLDQRRESLKPEWTLEDALTGGSGDTVLVQGQRRHVVGYMKDFLFSPDQRRTPISRLSGGERGRLMLARALAAPANLLVLDEPTNDLDLETLDLLQEMLADYDGTVLLVSHDRDFLDRVVTSSLFAMGNGKWQEFPGGYSDAIRQSTHSAPARPARQAAEKKTKPAAGSTAPAPRAKLSYKQKYALETLPGEIAALQDRIGELTARLNDPALYADNPDAFAKLSEELGAAQEHLSAAEDDWLQLEMLREELEGTA